MYQRPTTINRLSTVRLNVTPRETRREVLSGGGKCLAGATPLYEGGSTPARPGRTPGPSLRRAEQVGNHYTITELFTVLSVIFRIRVDLRDLENPDRKELLDLWFAHHGPVQISVNLLRDGESAICWHMGIFQDHVGCMIRG